MTDTKLTAERVNEVFLQCLFADEETPIEYLPAPGIITNMGFNPAKVAKYRDEISAMLDELPDEFQEVGGGGMSFLHACVDKHGNQWTGMHETMDQLFQLGLATGKVTCLVPREMWSTLPGRMPYYVVHTEFKEVEVQVA